MDVVYVGNCHLHGRFVATPLLIFPNLTSCYPISYMITFCAEDSSKQKNYKISRIKDPTLILLKEKADINIGIRPLYLSQILNWFYPINIWSVFGVSFLYLNKRRFQKHKKLTKICGCNRWSDHSIFTYKKLSNI